MSLFFRVLVLFICVLPLHLYGQDTLWIKKLDGKPYVIHKVNLGEDLFLLSKKYSVPPAALADANNLNYKSGLNEGTKIWIPLDNYNFIRVESVIKSRPIFYKTMNGDELDDVSRMVNVSQSTIQRWNHLNIPDIRTGQTLQIGWVAFDNQQVPFPDKKKEVNVLPESKPLLQANKTVSPATTNKLPLKKDTLKPIRHVDTVAVEEEDNAYEDLYNQQVSGQPSNNESGAAVFYPLKMKAAHGVYYAFHNSAEKGTIIKIINPSNDKFVYAKVIGKIPNLKEYNNSIIALSTNAAKELMAKEKRMFCKIEYR